MSWEIKSEACEEYPVNYVLYVNKERRVALIKRPTYPVVQFIWEIYGAQSWPEAVELVEGLVHLSILAEQFRKEEDDG